MNQDGNELRAFGLELPKKKEKRLDIRMMVFELYPQGGEDLDIRILINADPKVWFAPNLLVNFIFKKVRLVSASWPWCSSRGCSS